MFGIKCKKDIIYYDNMSFKKDLKGYYHNNKKESLHRYIYKKYKGKIKEDYVIHHKDGNKNNNKVRNLKMMTMSDHTKLHKANVSEETRLKLSQCRLGCKHTNKVKRIIALKRNRPVKCITTGKYYISLQEASKDTGAFACNISLVASGYRRTAAGLMWKYV